MIPFICFIACHANPADHFSVFAEELQERGCHVEIYASGPAVSKLPGASPFLPEKGVETEIARKCIGADIVITDAAHPFDIALQEALAKEAPSSIRAAYYDNPEDFVPGGFSETAAKVMQAAGTVLFANTNLVDLPIYQAPAQEAVLPKEKKVGIGYYPLAQAAAVAKLRREKGKEMRARLFKDLEIVDKGQKLLVYAGGNNEEYFSKAWPAFLGFIKEADSLGEFIVVLQQHPGARQENRDGRAAIERGVFLSKLSSQEVQAAADAMLYYQTSMAAQFVLAGIPTIQAGHNVYADILTKNGLCMAATTGEEFLLALKRTEEGIVSDSESIKKNLGIRSDWADRLEEFVRKQSGRTS